MIILCRDVSNSAKAAPARVFVGIENFFNSGT
jgi:hypothetical protein